MQFLAFKLLNTTIFMNSWIILVPQEAYREEEV